MNPEVSIITPLYNSEEYISSAIESVLNQSFQKWEMIIVDDCSLDNSVELVRNYCKKDSRIKLHVLPNNSGTGVVRNHALNKAKGRFIAFLDADDYWAKDKLKKQIDYMKENGYVFTYTDFYEFDNKTNALKNLIKCPANVNYSMLLKNGGYIGCLTVVYDTIFFGKRKMPEIRKRQDWALWLKMLREIEFAYGIPEPLAYYRLGNSSLSKSKIKLVKHNFMVFRRELNLSYAESIYRMFLFLVFHFFFKSKNKEIL